jgi:broad specificity phosphatase PhoE
MPAERRLLLDKSRVADPPNRRSTWIERLRDPAAAPHAGESILDLMGRVATWLADESVRDQRSIAITHSTIIRATIVHVMDAPPQSFWRVDIGALTVTRLNGLRGRWNLSAAGCTAV